MEADAAVARRDDAPASGTPVLDDTVDGARVEAGAVGEDDDRRLDVAAEGREAAAKRGARAELPVRAADHSLLGLELVCARDDDDLVHHPAAASAARTAGRWTRCFGGSDPYRDDAPAARTTAEMAMSR